MSFILDALKKSENDRQRQSGPALFEVRVAPPRSKFPLLAVAIVSLLVVNLGVVGWLMLRKPAAAAVPPAQVAAPAQYPAGAPAPAAPPPAYAGQPVGPAGARAPPIGAPPGGYGAAPAAGGAYPPPANAGYPPAGGGYPQTNQGGYGAPAREPQLADEGSISELNPDDYEPARAPAEPPPVNSSNVTRGTVSGLPTYEEVATRTSLPELHIDLHSYAADPAKRFVLVNMKRLYEGQALPDGVKVERITNEGAIISYNGTQFVLNRD